MRTKQKYFLVSKTNAYIVSVKFNIGIHHQLCNNDVTGSNHIETPEQGTAQGVLFGVYFVKEGRTLTHVQENSPVFTSLCRHQIQGVSTTKMIHSLNKS